MSDEPESLIQNIFMEKVGVKYPFIRSSGVNEKYAIAFFPSVYCISPTGEILTLPADRMPDETFLEEQLKNVSLVPKMPADSRFDVVRTFWQKKEHKRLADYLDKMLTPNDLDPELRAIYEAQKAELTKRSERQLARIDELGKGPDFGASADRLEQVARDWKGLPPGDRAEQELARFAKDAAITKEITASKALDKVLAKADTVKVTGRKKLIEELQKFSKKYSGTHAAAKADAMRSDLLTRR